MISVIQMRMRQAGRVRFFKVGGLDLSVDDYCIVQTERGLDFGLVLEEPHPAMEKEFEDPLRMVVRKITVNDRHQINKNIRDAQGARKACLAKIESHKLPMKLVDAEYSFDRNKLVFYFTADGRVDFRALVKDLARTFRARIELRQIGVRDESKLLGGTGCCGRIVCCQSWLRGFTPINIRMAKDQHLSLNPTKLSGVCGRLLCCLKYEHECYRQLSKGLPSNGAIVKTDAGKGMVIDQNILLQQITVRLENDTVSKVPVSEIEVLQAKPPRRKRNS